MKDAKRVLWGYTHEDFVSGHHPVRGWLFIFYSFDPYRYCLGSD